MDKNIKIIKRSQQDTTRKTADTRIADNQSARHATRDITGHVTSWIKEFQQRHTPDPRHAFASLFVDPATSQAD